MNKFKKALAEKIKEIRTERNLTQEKFAEIIEVSRDHIAKVETLKRNSTLDLLYRICKSFNISFKDLFDFEIE